GKPIFCATLFNCLGTISETHSFRPVWKPPFISRLAAEDRCHLNGLAGEGGEPRYVTMVSRSDVVDGWRDRRSDGGLVMDVASGEAVAGGLSMPHSPRLHDGTLYLLDSGTGRFGRVDVAAGRFEEIAFCPGFARGLSIVGDHALIGLSLPRENKTFTGLPLDQALTDRDTRPRCGLIVVDLKTGD
ncbi:MAG: TIGR03032 family protein, partial [Alphaproteobacteria bacterium]